MSSYIRPWPAQDPQANLDYWFDLTRAINEQGSALASYTVNVTGADAGLVKSGLTESGGVVYFWLADPTEDVDYTVTCHFELENGFADDISRTVTGQQR